MTIQRSNAANNLHFIKDILKINNQVRVLEIGSGSGYLVKQLLDEGYDAVGSEIDSQYVTLAKDQFNISLHQFGGESLDFPDNSFDLVVSFDVFEHIPDSDQHLREVSRVLKPGGRYVFSTPNILTNLPFEIIKERSFTKYKEYHVSLHSYWRLRSRLLENGFLPQFFPLPVVNDYFRAKVRKYLGLSGQLVLKIFSPDVLPIPFRTNFYVSARVIKK